MVTIKIPKEMIIDKLKEAGLTDQEIKTKVKDKLDQLSGLISEEGALHIIANELGIKIFEETGKLKIKNVIPGMKNVQITGKVVKVYEVREFDKDGKKGKVGSFLIGDQTGVIRVVAWNDKADLLQQLQENQVLKIENGYSRDNRGRMEVHLGDKTTVTLSPKDAEDIQIEQQNTRKKISELSGSEENIEILGTIVQVFDPKFFEVCPQCGKRARQKDDVFVCDTHDAVDPTYAYVVNLFLDDGSENVRVVLWRNQVQKLFGMTDQEMIANKDGPFEEIKTELLGKIVKFVGRTNKNEMFDRVEFIPQMVYTDPDPREELERLKNAEAAEQADKPKKLMDAKDHVVEQVDLSQIKAPAQRQPSQKPVEQPKKPAEPDSEELQDLDDIEELTDLDSL